MKYIDADKLKKSIGNYMEDAHAALNPVDGDADYYKGKIDACKDMQEFITSIQQEQPGVDLEKEIEDWCDKNITGVRPIYTADSLIYSLLPKTARHFFELGLNARND